jgi:microcin C transport system substrate-binding protein
MTFNPELDRLIEAYDRSETLDEIKRNAQEMEQIIHDQGWWVNGWSLPFHRTGYWRHVKWPEGFNAMQGRNAEEFFLHWVDEDERAATEKARRSGEKFPAQVLIFDQFNK